MSTNEKAISSSNSVKSFFAKIVRNQLFIPIAALLLLIIFNFAADIILHADTSFFKIVLEPSSTGNMVLSGNLITIIDNASELALLAIGMTLVTSASGGQDISVGATIAIAGSTILRIVKGYSPDISGAKFAAVIIGAFLLSVIVSALFGAFNGALVAYFKIQPMVATLILFTAGRSIAAWINNNDNISINDTRFGYFGNFIPGIPVPTPVFITIICIIVIALVLKFTNLRLYSQAVGINASSSRLNGINPKTIKLLSFIILGICVAVCGLIKVSRTSSITYAVIANNIEMDAILAVALGGNNLGGGKFNMTASVLGAYVIQFLTTTLFRMKVSSSAISAYKAIVVILLIIMSSPFIRKWLADRKNRRLAAKAGSNVRKEVA
ncbi:simple sugar transport system permease protein [Ruminococcaceae bacterium YAD3003]|nr:simple sugar transport system permease protein [Ruminococcaceae bacterium YAD3003]